MKTFQECLEQVINEAEHDLKSNPALYKKALAKAEQKAKYGDDYLLTIVKGMNAKKLSQADIDTLNDILKG